MHSTILSQQQLVGISGTACTSRLAGHISRDVYVPSSRAVARRGRPFTSRSRPQRLPAVTARVALEEALPDAAAQVVNRLKGTVYLAGGSASR